MTDTPNTKPFPVATRWRDDTPILELDPRQRATRYLRESMVNGRAGVDPDDPFVFSAVAFSTADATRLLWALMQCGHEISVARNGDGIRYRFVLSADVRRELRIDERRAGA